MANKQVIAYFMSDAERVAAEAALQNATTTESFVLGSVNEESIPALREQGLVVQEQHDTVAASDKQQALKVTHMAALGFMTVPADADGPAVPRELACYRGVLA